MIERGEVDITYNLPPQSLVQMKGNPQLRVIQVPGDRVLNYRLNVTLGPFTSKSVRKAFAYAMDYDALLKARAEEVSAPEGPVPRKYMGGWVPPGLITKQDLGRAQKLLSEAGVNPAQLDVTLNIAGGALLQVTAAEVLQASLKKIGVNARIKVVDFAPTFLKLQRFAKSHSPADAEDTMTLVRGPFVPHPYAYFSSYVHETANNFMDYRNDRVQQLFQLGYAFEGRDPEKALDKYKEAVGLIVEDQPDLWMYVEKRVVVLRSNIQGYYMHPIWFPETHAFPLSRR
jgi:peptide/nickel transport system substrate-binding protein